MKTALPVMALAASVIGGFAIPPLAAQQVELRAITTLPRNLTLAQTFIQICGEITASARGTLKCNYLGGPEVTPSNRAADALKRGLVDLMHSPTSYYQGVVPESDAILVAERTPDEIRANGGWEILEKIWNERINAHILGWYEYGFRESESAPAVDLYNIYFTRKPPLHPRKGLDLSGFKIRTTPTYRELLVALGATPVSTPPAEIYTTLQRGVVQGFGYPGVALTGLGVVGIVKYRVDPAFFKGNNLVVVNLAKWKAMPKGARDLLERTIRAGEVRSTVYLSRQQKKEEAELKKAGMEILTLEGEAARTYKRLAIDGIWERLEKRSPNARALRAKFDK